MNIVILFVLGIVNLSYIPYNIAKDQPVMCVFSLFVGVCCISAGVCLSFK